MYVHREYQFHSTPFTAASLLLFEFCLFVCSSEQRLEVYLLPFMTIFVGLLLIFHIPTDLHLQLYLHLHLHPHLHLNLYLYLWLWICPVALSSNWEYNYTNYDNALPAPAPYLFSICCSSCPRCLSCCCRSADLLSVCVCVDQVQKSLRRHVCAFAARADNWQCHQTGKRREKGERNSETQSNSHFPKQLRYNLSV